MPDVSKQKRGHICGILRYYQLISHFNPRTIRAATVLLLVQIALTIAHAITGHTRTPTTALVVLRSVIKYTTSIVELLFLIFFADLLEIQVNCWCTSIKYLLYLSYK